MASPFDPTPETRVCGDTWTLRVYYVDQVTGAPVALTASELAPFGEFLQPATGTTTDLTVDNGGVEIFDDAGGAVDFILKPAVTKALVAPPGSLLPPPPIRIQALARDSSADPKTYGIKVVQPLDPLRTDLSLVKPPSAFFVDVGPRGPLSPALLAEIARAEATEAVLSQESFLNAVIFG